VISRVADHCFWFGRYVERAESTARTLAATGSLALDAELPPAQVWRPVVVVSGEEARFSSKITGGDDDHAAIGDAEIVKIFAAAERGEVPAISADKVTGAVKRKLRAWLDFWAAEVCEDM
jgi:uncharacterized alpha-E superfamily protein